MRSLFNQISKFKIDSKDGLVPFELHTHQKLTIQFIDINNHCLLLRSRQSGLSLGILAYLLTLVINENKNVIVLDNSFDSSETKLQILKSFIDDHKKITITKNKLTFLDGGGSISLLHTTHPSINNDDVCQGTILWIDDYYKVNYKVADAIEKEVIDKGGKVILLTTLVVNDRLDQKIKDPNYAKMVVPYYAVGISENRLEYYNSLLGSEATNNQYLVDFKASLQ